MPVLVFMEGERTLFRHRLQPGRTVVGRSDRCDVALPSEDVSRVHCVVERRGDVFWVSDRSRHGTRINGSQVQRAELSAGDQLGIGPYTARFVVAAEVADSETTTTTMPATSAMYEELVEVHDGGLAACRAVLRASGGPKEGESMVLSRSRSTLGGPGADVVLDDELPRNAAVVRVVRGRVMVEPGAVSCMLAGQRVREITPAMVGEELRLGPHSLVVEVSTVEEGASDHTSFGESVGQAPSMRRLFGILRRVAVHDAPVLLTGESGTGKELAARALHEVGIRRDGPFVAVNCAAISEQLFESELFGHEKGSFTGATHRQEGAFQRAHKGTLMLDEVGELKIDAQAKLLRALESGEVRRVGGASPEYPDVRVVAATNRNLQHMVRAGTFRSDLYFRLAVLTVGLPALRERREDIPMLARTLLSRNHPSAKLTPDAERALQTYEWPGNIRELRNVLTRAFVLSGPTITPDALHFNPWAFEEDVRHREEAPPPPSGLSEKELIEDALRRNGGNRTRAARELRMPRSSLLYKIKRHGITG